MLLRNRIAGLQTPRREQPAQGLANGKIIVDDMDHGVVVAI